MDENRLKTAEKINNIREKAKSYKSKLEEIERLMGTEYYEWYKRTMAIKETRSMYFVIDKKLQDLRG